MDYIVEQDWTTKSGLRAVVVRYNTAHLRQRCGYVAITASHPAFGRSYDEQFGTCSLETTINVHGGLTYNSREFNSNYPVAGDNLWWFGFDTAHYGDYKHNNGQSLGYCISECESMAKQLVALDSWSPL